MRVPQRLGFWSDIISIAPTIIETGAGVWMFREKQKAEEEAREAAEKERKRIEKQAQEMELMARQAQQQAELEANYAALVGQSAGVVRAGTQTQATAPSTGLDPKILAGIGLGAAALVLLLVLKKK